MSGLTKPKNIFVVSILDEKVPELDRMRQYISDLVHLETDLNRLRQIFSWMLGLGGETPEMMQLHEFRDDTLKDIQILTARIDSVESKWNKLFQIVKYMAPFAAALGLGQVVDIIKILGV